MNSNTLTPEQTWHFRSQGYLRLPAVLDRETTARLRKFVDEEAARERAQTSTLGSRALKLYNLYDRNPELISEIIKAPRLTLALEVLLGPNIVFVKNRHNHATVNNHKGAPSEGLHRDILQSTRGLVTAAVYLENSNVLNGATRIIPGSHNLPYVGVPQPGGGGTWLAEHEEFEGMEDQALPVPVNEGDVLLFNALVFHGVGNNISGQTRRSLTLGYRSADELDYSPDTSRQILVSGEFIYRGNDAKPR